MVHSTRRFVLSIALCYFVLVFFNPFSIVITSLGEERSNLRALRTFVRYALVWFCLFHLPLGVWEGLRLVIVALPGLFSYLFSYWLFQGRSSVAVPLFVYLCYSSLLLLVPRITKTRLFKYIENFTSKNKKKNSDKKTLIVLIFLLKT